MIAISLLLGIIIIGSIWFFIGRFIWRKTVKRFIRHRPTFIVVTLLLIPVWFVGPFMDEILGASKFEQLCQQLPPAIFSGPVDVGPGKFFDENGKPRWKDEGDFSVHFWNEKEWKELFEKKSSWPIITNWPMPISELHYEITEKKSGRVVVLSRTILSPGGWVRRIFGLSLIFRRYSCTDRGLPRTSELVRFKPQQSENK
nr:hypothetical protein [uncultured Tolumonas sp.]